MERGFVLADEFCRTNVPGVYAVGDLVPACSSRTSASPQGIMVAERDRRARAPRRSTTTASRGSPTATRRSPRSASPRRTAHERYGDDKVEHRDLRPGRQRQEPDPQDRRASSSWSGRGRPGRRHPHGRRRVGELIAEAQLIYNWEALPRRRRPAHPRPPDPDRGGRRGAPRPGRQAAARARLTAHLPDERTQ